MAALLLLSAAQKTTAIAAANEITITIDTTNKAQHKEISPYIYGVNGVPNKVTQFAARSGGNRMTGYNWEINLSNAGNDWYHVSDNWLTTSMSTIRASRPAAVITEFVKAATEAGAYPLVTLPMAGYVVKDGKGTVNEDETAPSKRWAQVVHEKPGELLLTPDPTDGFVYTDELLNFLIHTLGDSTTETGIKGYCLDNEPALWSETHSRIHPEKVTVDELIERSVDLALVVKKADPAAEIFGPILYGYGAYLSLQDAPDWLSKYKNQYKWFIDCYLDKMKEAEQQHGKRLLDVLDVHYYTEDTSSTGHRVSFDSDVGVETQKTRVQSTRTMWDAEYHENSWIEQWFSNFLPVLPTLNESIEKYYPGTKLSVTEYCFGAEGHISGGVAQADALGIFAENNVYFASLWSLSDEGQRDYAYAAMNLYTNYNSEGGRFGDTLVSASTSNIPASSVYASMQGENDNELHVMLINRDLEQINNFTLDITSNSNYETAAVYTLDETTSEIQRGTDIAISGNPLTYEAKPMSVTHLVLTGTSKETAPETTKRSLAVPIGIGSACTAGAAAYLLIKKKK